MPSYWCVAFCLARKAYKDIGVLFSSTPLWIHRTTADSVADPGFLLPRPIASAMAT